MQSEIEKDKRYAVSKLKDGLREICADDLTEVMINLDGGTCDYVELIPILEEIARVQWFYYFDDNGSGGAPRADTRRRSSFKPWAEKAIANIRENALFESSSIFHHALKSNSTGLIKNALQQLKSQDKFIDKSLVPILEKIARKDAYEKYSYIGGFEKDCQLGDLARQIIQIINRPAASSDIQDKPVSVPTSRTGECSVCSALPEDLTVNTGREEYFPSAFGQLVGIGDDYRAEFRYCPGCRTYFHWIDMPQMYGSGNNDEERLVRMSLEKSMLLDKLFTADSSYRATSGEIEEFLQVLPLDLVVPALSFHLYRNRELIKPFVPQLLRWLGKNNDTALWSFLQGYVSDNPARAEEIIEAFRSGDEYPPNRVSQIVHHCLRVVKKK